MTIGERVAQIRNEAGLSMAAFANRLAVTSGTISMWEHNQRNLSDQAVKVLCQEFSINEAWLRSGTGPKKQENADSPFIQIAKELDRALEIPDIQTKEMLEKLLKIWMTLDKEHKKVLFEVIEKLKKDLKKD